MLLPIVVSLFFHTRTTALPTPIPSPNNITSGLSPTVGWTSTPQVRGTFDLLLSCLTTLFLCAWTAYHPNVYGVRSFWRQTGHRLLWMLIAVFLPEVVLFCAWEQWWATRKLRETVNELGNAAFSEGDTGSRDYLKRDNCRSDICRAWQIGQSGADSTASSDYNLPILFQESDQASLADRSSVMESPSVVEQASTEKQASDPENKDKKQDVWTMEQAFFAFSGGFGVDSSSFFPQSRLTFTVPGLIFLAKIGLLPNESPDAVNDKSKADYVAKILVCLQAGWFFVQCIARVAQKLPLTLLELHVLAHVLCAFAMYLLWIQKPYDVSSPILCRDEKVVDLAALFALHTVLEPRNQRSTIECPHSNLTTLQQAQRAHTDAKMSASHHRYFDMVMHYFDLGRWKYDPDDVFRITPPLTRTPREAEVEHHTRANRALAYLKSRDIHLNFRCFHPEHPFAPEYPASPSCVDGQGPSSESPSESRTEEPSREEIAFNSAPQAFRLEIPYVVGQRSNLRIDGHTSFSTKEPEDVNVLLPPEAGETAVMRACAGFAILGALYGALHLIAWSSAFPTEAERWGWRASGIVMVAAPTTTVIFMYFWDTVDRSATNNRRAIKKGPKPPVAAQIPAVTRVKLWRWLRIYGYHMVTFFCEWIGYVGISTTAIAWPLYPFARAFVLGEALAQLRAVDRDVYQTVEWAGFLPHIG